MNRWQSLVKESRIVQWLLFPDVSASFFQGSKIFQGTLKGLSQFSFLKKIPYQKVSTFACGLLILLLYSTIFMPRIFIGAVGLSRVDLRGEDLIFPLLLLLVFGMVTKRRTFSEIPAVEKAFIWFLVAGQISIFSGLLMGTVDRPFVSLLYLSKWFEYFLIFVIATLLCADSKTSTLFLRAFFLLGILVALYGYWEHLLPAERADYPSYYRLYERFPFYGNANHIGGFLVLWILFFTGILFNSNHWKEKLLLLTALVFTFFPLAWTYSRKSYFALGGSLILSFVFGGNRKRMLFLVSLLVLVCMIFPTRIMERLTDLQDTLTSTDPFHSSWAGNWVMWKESLWNFDKFFIFGSGFGSRHRLFYESQYIQILTETGLVGFLAFLFLCFSPVQKIIFFLRQSLNKRERGIASGWLLAFMGLMIHSLSCVSFTVTKTAIPFWFLTAVVLSHLQQSQRSLS